MPTDSAPNHYCPWCSAEVTAAASHCPACGAAIAQRESIGDLVIPGVTAVDPALELYAAQPLRIPGPSPNQSMTGRAIVEGALAAADYLGAGPGGDGPIDLASVGRPSGAALLAVERLEQEEVTASQELQASSESPAVGPA
jgi:hypothetical protein